MARKILGISVVVLLVGALIGGGVYLLLRGSNNGGSEGRAGQNRAVRDSSGARSSRWNGEAESLVAVERSAESRGGNAALRGGDGTGTPEADVAPEDWLTVTGTVVAVDYDLVVATPDGAEVAFNLGPSWYRESESITIAVGDPVRVTAFYEDGELMAGTVETRSTGQSLPLRAESGQALWSGRGQRGQ